MKLPAFLVPTAVFVALALAGVSQPAPDLRRALTAAEIQRIQELRPTNWLWKVDSLQATGISPKLTQEQLDYFRQRGTNELFLLEYVAEFGITPEESGALLGEGVNMVLRADTEMTVFHWAAFADAVVAGTVVRTEGVLQGPYHTTVYLRPDTYFKNCLDLPSAPTTITGSLLFTGPRIHRSQDDIHRVEGLGEPNLKSGEKVLLFLSRVPLNLRALLASAAANRSVSSLEREFGNAADLHRILHQPVTLEILLAYKIVGDKAVIKNRAYRIERDDDVVDFSFLKNKVGRIAAAQSAYCRSR